MTIKKLYSNSYAPNPLRVTYMLKIKGIKLDFTNIDIMKGEQFSPDYKAISPEGTVPAMVLKNGTVLTDVISILYYIEKKYPGTPLLMGKNTIERAQILGLIHQIHFSGLMSVAEVLRNGFVPGFEGRALPGNTEIKQIPELMERGRSRIHYFYQQIDKKLENKGFLVGNSITQADIDLFVFCNFAGFVKEPLNAEKTPNLASHHKMVEAIINI